MRSPKAELLEAIKFAHKHIADICAFQKEFAEEVGIKKRELKPAEDISEMTADVKNLIEARYEDSYRYCSF